jgi:hypothetical protein
MGEAVTRIMSNPEEAWFVIDGALTVLSIAPIPVLQENLPNILKWTTVEDWWLRESAFLALMGLQRDEALFVSHLPTIIDMMIREYNYNPQQDGQPTHGSLAEARERQPGRQDDHRRFRTRRPGEHDPAGRGQI